MPVPRLTFFCELEVEPLRELFAGTKVIDHLVALRAAVSLGLLDLSAERAEVVRRLNQAGVPVVAWLLLPEEQGYWPNAGNVEAVAERYDRFRAWSAESDLRWDGIGLDVEFDKRELIRLIADWRSALPGILRRTFDSAALTRASRGYAALVARFHADGYRVDSYVIPLIADERRMGSTLLQRIGGLVDVQVDREVPMLYSSFLGSAGTGILWSYGQKAQSVGVGSTGGGVEIPGVGAVPVLDWAGFSRDLRLALQLTDDVHVFSLEGCVRLGFLDRLVGFDWSEPVAPPLEIAEGVERFRRTLRGVLWADAHALELLLCLIAAVWLLRRAPRRRR